jgi:DNA invertase Pin-like site-specific DNA recombinase
VYKKAFMELMAMKENENQLKDTESRKAKIRARYKGVDPDELDVIPAVPQTNFYEDEREKRVAVYVRVSTDDPRQTSSYELQKNHYIDVVSSHVGWKLVDIYADEGISGTSLQHRDAFVRMIADCKDGKLDLIVTKSVSRFARNVLDCIGYVRQLAAMRPPIGILFETENIYTLNRSSEMSLSFISTLAQEESHNKSDIMNASIEMRFHRGIFLTPPLLGYDQDADGNLVINEEEAKTVRLIFFMYLYGYTCQQIAETLTALGRPTKKKNTTWSSRSILQVLQNERHCGDVLARKTWTPNYLDHKSRKNCKDRNQYRERNHHEAIVSRDDFIAVQRLISNARYGNKGILPELQVIPDGALKGFVSINPRWAGFKAEDYRLASASVYDEVTRLPSVSLEVEAQSGDFDLRGFEIARSQFFDTAHKLCVTFSSDGIIFSTECIRKFNKVLYVEMLIHPDEFLLTVRPCSKGTRNAVQWAKLNEGQCYPRNICCAAYINTLYEMLGWNNDCKYRVRGVRKQKDKDMVVIFSMRETEMFIPSGVLESGSDSGTTDELLPDDLRPLPIGPNNSIVAFPSSWADNFGNNYYRHAQARELAVFDKKCIWNISKEGQPFSDSPELQITSAEVIDSSIKRMINDMKQEAPQDGD